MVLGCQLNTCTLAETGSCALGHDPASCPNATAQAPPVAEVIEPTKSLGDPTLSPPAERPRFSASSALPIAQVADALASKPGRVIGILGEPDSGKTAYLASLYLLLSRSGGNDISFCDSRSLMAFDAISRGARAWVNGPPEQFTAHTEMAEDRAAGFMHIRLRTEANGPPLDFYLPDLPGEWTKALIESARFDRWEFLRAADGIWIFVDGRKLASREYRQGALHRLELLVDRLAAIRPRLKVPLQFAVTRRDEAEISEATASVIKGVGEQRGFVTSVVGVASFSINPAVPPGEGVLDLLRATETNESPASLFWPRRIRYTPGERRINAYGDRNVF